jgi:hypothetical protein
LNAIRSWLRSRRRRARRQERLTGRLFVEMLRCEVLPEGWSEEDCAQVAALLAKERLNDSRARAEERWARSLLARAEREAARGRKTS